MFIMKKIAKKIGKKAVKKETAKKVAKNLQLNKINNVVNNRFKSLKNSKTFENLLKAFEGESKAFTSYLYFASKAKKEGYVQIADYFSETANNEKEHAKIWFKLLTKNNEVPSTSENLESAAKGEHYESSKMYPEFAKIAKKEGFTDIARLFELVAEIENRHHERFIALANSLKKGKVFKSDNNEKWICTNCGNVVTGKSAPILCPFCKHQQAYYKRLKKDY